MLKTTNFRYEERIAQIVYVKKHYYSRKPLSIFDLTERYISYLDVEKIESSPTSVLNGQFIEGSIQIKGDVYSGDTE
jgi:hypothetical protein